MVADTPDYPVSTLSADDVASTIVSYYASTGMVSGYTQEGAMDVFTLDGRDAASTRAHGAGHDRLVIAVANGKGDFTVVFAYSAKGEMGNYEADLKALAATTTLR
jgi:hypothetical protein